MKKTLLVMTMAIALALSTIAGAFANGRWDNQVTGGVTFDAGDYTDVELDVSTRADGDVSKGQIQYTRSDLSVHIAVNCVHEGTEGYAFSGPTNVQNGSFNAYASAEVNSDGTAIRFRGHDDPPTGCGYSGNYPGSVKTGSFNIR